MLCTYSMGLIFDREHKDPLGHKDLQASLENLAALAQLDHPAQMGRLETRVALDLLATPAPLEDLAHP